MILNPVRFSLKRMRSEAGPNVLQIEIVEGRKWHIRLIADILQKFTFPCFSFSFQCKAALALLPMLSFVIRVIKLAVPCTAFVILVRWHG